MSTRWISTLRPGDLVALSAGTGADLVLRCDFMSEAGAFFIFFHLFSLSERPLLRCKWRRTRLGSRRSSTSAPLKLLFSRGRYGTHDKGKRG